MIKMSLSQTYPYRTELHAHTSPASLCGRLSPEELVELYLSLGVQGIVITNHLNTYSRGDRPIEQYAEDYLDDYYRAKKSRQGHVALGEPWRRDPL